MTKIVFSYSDSGVFLQQVELNSSDISPLEPGVWLIPANTTEEAPPEPVGNLYPHWLGNRWELRVVTHGGTGTEIPAPTPSLEELKAVKNEEIDDARLVANFSSFPYQGKYIQCDQLSRSDIDATNNYVSLFGTLPPDFLGGWKTTDNSYVAIPDVIAWKEFFLAFYNTGFSNFTHSQALKEQLALAETPEEVEAIHWGMSL